MVRLYFVCMGNYYRSRLAEELALHYAAQLGLEVIADSGGLSSIPNPNHPGTIAKGTLQYLRELGVEPRNAGRFPKSCTIDDVYSADIVVCTDAEEQQDLFLQGFPEFKGRLIGWNARDIKYAAIVDTTKRIDKHVKALIEELANERKNKI